ncbi:hypothetical protein MNBD_ALPHA04-1513, partial [hydrothermal vent metagenome]
MPHIRQARAEDAASCAEIYAPFVEDSWISFEIEAPNETEMAARIKASINNHEWLVAEVDDEIAGYAYGSPHRSRTAYHPSCDVSVYVNRDYARQGVGQALYKELLLNLKTRKL